MTLMRFDPFRELDRVADQMLSGARTARILPMEAFRRGEEFFVLLDVPGVELDDINLTLERNVVSVRAERKPVRQEGDEVLVDERPMGTFTRQLFLGDNLDSAAMTASLGHGVLILTIPVAEESKPRRVQIEASSPGRQSISTEQAG